MEYTRRLPVPAVGWDRVREVHQLVRIGPAAVGAPIVSALAALPPLWMIAGHLLIPFIAMHGRFRTTRGPGT